MDEDNEEENTSSQYRSPAYSKDEVQALVKQVEVYKHIILNKCTNTTTNHAKEVAWLKISKDFNKQGFRNLRSVDSLKIKWDNLKKEARKLSKNILDVRHIEFDDVLSRIVTMMSETEENSYNTTDGILQHINDANEDNQQKFWEENYDNSEGDDSNDGDESERLSRSFNFSPQECSLLLKCVRDEKKHIFSKVGTGKAIKLKNNAWSRITYTFNKQSPQKRTTKVLRTKFNNMKRMAKCVGFKGFKDQSAHKKISDHEVIKTEPEFQYKDDPVDEESNDMENATEKVNQDLTDPLSLVLNGDSGIDSISHFGSCSTDNKEIVKLKLDLINYQLENAKLERQRIEQAVAAEASERQLKKIESSLRLRAARLAAVAEELRLPSNHPALQYTAEELHAQEYMQQFQ
ncbi:hypothetical protein KGM_213587 [Danaus plexippus plexippus]|uniref:Regulatory protein zeste n=1 Tax=Danaus plexippus plexippus TaxID=278856 RepID=A0A212ENT0_DANPL|nr:hypothetical protein KGM_213587 [Danaus plexippus plexippus]